MKIQTSGSQDVFAPPASYAQERLWFLEQFEPNTAVYNIPYVATLKGTIHRNAFNKAVNRLIARHESLRTCFIESAGQPRQAVHPRLSVEVDFEDLRSLDEQARAARLQAICTEVTSTPFDLRAAPLFRIMLAASARETTIIMTFHHIIADGWSVGIFQRELAALYQEELGGTPAALPEFRIQYADYAVWQRGQLHGENLDRLKRYWSLQLDGAPTVLEIPGDRARPAKQTFVGDVYMFDLGPTLTSEIRALTLRQDATLFMTLFSIFAVLLYRLTGQKDILVGTPIAGRISAEVEHLIGLFVNTLVLRASMEPDMRFVDLLAQVKTMMIGAFEHQQMPFEKLVLELNPKRDLSHSPLVQVLFSLQNIPPLQELMTAGAESDVGAARNLDGHTGTAKFDFALFIWEIGDKLQCSVEFNTDLFSPPTVADIGEYFTALMRGVAHSPEAKIASYPLMLARTNRRRLAWSAGKEHRNSDAGCHHLYEMQCRRSPDAIAVSYASRQRDERMTYAELNGYANRIARHLIGRGVRPRARVAICMQRGIRQIAAVLGVVKAGAAYVPLDPEYPVERLRFIVGDIDAQLLVGGAETSPGLEDCAEKVDLTRDASEILRQSSDDLDVDHSPHTPLYVIYTSGSTGRPKGVVMPHRSIVNLIEWQARVSSIHPGAATLQYAPLNFDVASQEIFSTLTTGGCLQLIDDHLRRDSGLLLEFLSDREIARLFLPPVALEQLAITACARNVRLEKLREVIVAGDRLQITDSVRSFFERATGAQLINQYGPTESHVVSAHTLEGPPSGWPSLPAIGTPIDNVQLYVLDDELGLVPPNVNGELYIGGAALALGYLNLPEENSSRFVKNPFRNGDEVLYRTGDVCRYNRERVLSFVGRADRQIKLRGFRIEPEEVEIVLKGYAGIKEAVVVKRRSRQGEDRLVAYVVAKGRDQLDKSGLRTYLGHKIPVYMIPTHFVRLDSLPLTGSGKVDRIGLLDPEDNDEGQPIEQDPVYPRTPIEQFLADCWRSLLRVERVSVSDNFFDLGGHSLTATQLVSRIRDEYGVELPLSRIFERSTIELLALEILQITASQEEQSTLETLLSELESMSDEESEEMLCSTENRSASQRNEPRRTNRKPDISHRTAVTSRRR
jgi:amino acid adenylation domain-containing protein